MSALGNTFIIRHFLTMFSSQTVSNGRYPAFWSGAVLVFVATVFTRCNGYTVFRNHVRSNLHLLHFSFQSSDTDPTFDTIMRFELKKELLQAADEFQELQREMYAMAAEEKQGKTRWFGRQRKDRERIGGEFVYTVRISHQIRFIVLIFFYAQVYMVLRVLRLSR